ncbi:MAG: NAD(P)-dependent oxidoreductase [Betaproteobacteria bacterium]|nr:NAD(P)-dependent oxidoreductase [Betaproteobacteria bacterium]
MSSGKAVVFGGSGFIGSHVADALDDAGYSVTVFDIRQSD